MPEEEREEVVIGSITEMHPGDMFIRGVEGGILVSRKKAAPVYEPTWEQIQAGVEALRALGHDFEAGDLVKAVLRAAIPEVLKVILPRHRVKVQQAAQREMVQYMVSRNYLTPQTRYSTLRHYGLLDQEESETPHLRAVE